MAVRMRGSPMAPTALPPSRRHAVTLRIGGGGLDSLVGPRLHIVNRVNDAATDLAIERSSAEGPVLFQGPRGQTEKASRFSGSQ